MPLVLSTSRVSIHYGNVWLTAAVQLVAMNPTYKRIVLPPSEPTPWKRVFRSLPHVTDEACDLMSKLLQVCARCVWGQCPPSSCCEPACVVVRFRGGRSTTPPRA